MFLVVKPSPLQMLSCPLTLHLRLEHLKTVREAVLDWWWTQKPITGQDWETLELFSPELNIYMTPLHQRLGDHCRRGHGVRDGGWLQGSSVFWTQQRSCTYEPVTAHTDRCKPRSQRGEGSWTYMKPTSRKGYVHIHHHLPQSPPFWEYEEGRCHSRDKVCSFWNLW